MKTLKDQAVEVNMVANIQEVDGVTDEKNYYNKSKLTRVVFEESLCLNAIHLIKEYRKRRGITINGHFVDNDEIEPEAMLMYYLNISEENLK